MKNVLRFLFFCMLLNMGCKKKLEKIEVDCSKLSQLLREIHKSDQDIRMEGDFSKIDFDLMKKIDSKNLSKVVSIIEQCGMPTSNEIDKEQIETIFLVIQHSSIKYQKKYFSLLENSSKNGDLKESSIAKLKDRILVYEGKPQVYGTQLKLNIKTNTSTLVELENPESVNKRRKQVGLEPLQEFLKEYDIEFNVKQIE